METLNLDKLLNESKSETQWATEFLEGNSYAYYPTIMIIATRGKAKKNVQCPSCKHPFEVEHRTGLHPWVVESWKRFIKPMNMPVIDVMISGYEVGEAYEKGIESILANPNLNSFRHILFMEDDVIVPYMNNSFGPLSKLTSNLDKYDVVSGLYWTKGEPSLPLVYGDGKMEGGSPMAVNRDWKMGDVVEVNGCGMGFTLMKREVFENPKLEKPFFKTISEIKNHVYSGFTQDLYFYSKIKALGYKIAVDTGVRCGHLDFSTDIIY